MLTRILIILGLVALALWMLRKALGRPVSHKTPEAKEAKEAKTTDTAGPRKDPPALGLVACTRCGLHLPRSEAVWQADQPFCSEAHANSTHSTGPQG
jgi:hypothetical protein